jgi:hypothetical protein
MTLAQFDNGYWYATELKTFATSLGIPSAGTLRKDELERVIRHLLKTGKVERPTNRAQSTRGIKDVERGLTVDLPVAVYTNDPETKQFLEREALKVAPGMKRKSGARYRLNRWREQQIARGREISYGDLVHEYVRLNLTREPFARIPHGRYINFMSDFLAGETGATRAEAVRAWKRLKTMDAPKTYQSWREHQGQNRKSTPR